MTFDRTPLAQKIANKGYKFTPLEVFQLKHLSDMQDLDSLAMVFKGGNLYQAAKERVSSMRPMIIDMYTHYAAQEYPEAYRSCKYAYGYLMQQDEGIGIEAYKGVALIAQIEAMRHEFVLDLTLESSKQYRREAIARPPIETKDKLDKFTAYSYIHEEQLSFGDIVLATGKIFKHFMMGVDNIVTLNYYLKELIDIKDLESIKYLRMWLRGGRNSVHKNRPFMKLSDIFYYPNLTDHIIDSNHKDFVESLEDRIHDLPIDFAENSLSYVKKIIRGVADEELGSQSN